MSWWVMSALNVSPVFLISWIFWVITSIVLHELGHGIAAIRCGDDTPIITGHMTWNPLIHMGQMSLIMFALFGFCWGLMPVNPRNFRRRYDDALVAFAGPAVNLILYAVCMAIAIFWNVAATRVPEPLRHNMHIFWFTGCMINLMGFCFNLIPVPPLDGSRIAASFFIPYREFLRTETGAIAAVIGTALLFTVGGGAIWHFVLQTTASMMAHGVALFNSGVGARGLVP